MGGHASVDERNAKETEQEKMTGNALYTRRIRAILGENACIGYQKETGMLAAFLTHDFRERPYVIAGEEESLIRLAKEKKESETCQAH